MGCLVLGLKAESLPPSHIDSDSWQPRCRSPSRRILGSTGPIQIFQPRRWLALHRGSSRELIDPANIVIRKRVCNHNQDQLSPIGKTGRVCGEQRMEMIDKVMLGSLEVVLEFIPRGH